MAKPTIRSPDDPDVLRGPADWPTVQRWCACEHWRHAYHAANGDPAAEAYIEERKAAALARLTAEWAARKHTERQNDHGEGTEQDADHRASRARS
jgi:hypothetical protein